MHYNNLPVIVKRLSSHNDGDYNHRGENYGRLPAQTLQMRSRTVVATPTAKWQYYYFIIITRRTSTL